MKTTLLLAFLLLMSSKAYSQEYIFGKVLSEDQRELRSVTVINISTQQTTTTNEDGNFVLLAKVGDEIRFSKERYYRVSERISSSNISKTFVITLNKMPHDIEEVEIKFRLTGDLKKDADHFGKEKRVLILETDVGKYIRQKSDPEIMQPKPGEFVQPVGLGFSGGGSEPRWDDLDFYSFLMETLPKEFFIDDLKLKQFEIMNFVFYIFKDFPRRDILKYGSCDSKDLMRFQVVSFQKIEKYNFKFSKLKQK